MNFRFLKHIKHIGTHRRHIEVLLLEYYDARTMQRFIVLSIVD